MFIPGTTVMRSSKPSSFIRARYAVKLRYSLPLIKRANLTSSTSKRFTSFSSQLNTFGDDRAPLNNFVYEHSPPLRKK